MRNGRNPTAFKPLTDAESARITRIIVEAKGEARDKLVQMPDATAEQVFRVFLEMARVVIDAFSAPFLERLVEADGIIAKSLDVQALQPPADEIK